MVKKFTYFFVLVLLITSCKTTKTVTNTSIVSISTKKIIKNQIKNSFDRKTVKAKIKAKYIDANNAQPLTIKLRLEKDKTIWMSGTFFSVPVAKILITPTRVSYYDKIHKTYFDGNFSLLSQFLGTEVDFEKVQNLLLGQPILNLKNQRYYTEIDQDSYLVFPKKQNKLFDILFWINPTHFKTNKQEISRLASQETVTITYPEYQQISKVTFPKQIKIVAKKNTNKTILNLEYRAVEFDKTLSFPFKIPVGYKEITLK